MRNLSHCSLFKLLNYNFKSCADTGQHSWTDGVSNGHHLCRSGISKRGIFRHFTVWPFSNNVSLLSLSHSANTEIAAECLSLLEAWRDIPIFKTSSTLSRTINAISRIKATSVKLLTVLFFLRYFYAARCLICSSGLQKCRVLGLC